MNVMAVKKWIPIVAGIVIFVVIVGLGLVAGAVYLFTRQVGVQTMASAEAGGEEFEKLRGALAGQTALIELPPEDGDGEAVVHRELATHPTGQVSVLHVRVWAPRDRKLVRVDLPMWTLRLMGSKPITINTGHGSFGGVPLRVTAEDIDRRGPGLIIDHTARRGERLLVWSE
jgi:hypothetical protein